jgi:hypothetical protein
MKRCKLPEALAQESLLGNIGILCLDRLASGCRKVSSRMGLRMTLNSLVTLIWRRQRGVSALLRMMRTPKTAARVRTIPNTLNA